MSAMRPWLQRSELVRYIDSIIPSTGPAQPLSPMSTPGSPRHLGNEEISKLSMVIEAFHTLRLRLASFPAYMIRHIDDTLKWMDLVRRDHPIGSPSQQYERLSSFRSLILWLPSTLLNPGETDLGALAMIAHFYCLAIVIKPLFLDCEGMHLDALVITPLEQICRTIETRANASPSDTALQTAVAMLEVPVKVSMYYRSIEMVGTATNTSSGLASPFSLYQPVAPPHDRRQPPLSPPQQYSSYSGPYAYNYHATISSGRNPLGDRSHSYPRIDTNSSSMATPTTSGIRYSGMPAHVSPEMYTSGAGYHQLSRQASLPQVIVPSNAGYDMVPPPIMSRSYDQAQMQAYAMEYGMQ